MFQAETIEHLPERLAHMLSGTDRDVLVAIDDGSGGVVGMIVVTDDSVGEVTQIPVLNVTHLVVSPQHRRRGVGRALLAATVHLADQRRIENIVATAVTGSREANRYLARLGFAPLVVRRIAPTSVLRRSLGLSDSSDREHSRHRVPGSREANRYLARLGFAPLVVRRIAPTSVLRRSLGLSDSSERVALLRRARIVRRGARAVGRI
jgi:GNAT superfamily N-acetyltransferase